MKHQKLETAPAISRRMSKVHLKRGRAETTLAKALWHDGYRYRLNDRRLPGSPDIAILKYKVAVFVDGEFWHGYRWAERKDKLKSNREYWIEKIEENQRRDARDDRTLEDLGWIPIHLWEKEVLKDLPMCIRTVENAAIQRMVEALPDEAVIADCDFKEE